LCDARIEHFRSVTEYDREGDAQQAPRARIWRKWDLQPWRVETFKFSTDPELDAKVRDVVGLYLAPPDKAVVLSIDEKSQVQALDRTAPILPLRPGLPEKQTHERGRAEFGTKRSGACCQRARRAFPS
jgi:hypothetical protein